MKLGYPNHLRGDGEAPDVNSFDDWAVGLAEQKTLATAQKKVEKTWKHLAETRCWWPHCPFVA